MKRIFKRSLIILVIFFLLIGASLAISKYRRNQVQLSVVNKTTYQFSDLVSLLEEHDPLYVMIYDSQSNDCIYLDEVLLKEISYEHEGIEFNEIYKITYDDLFRTYIYQTVKNTYHVASLPAIVTLQKTKEDFETLDAYEWVENPQENRENLEAYLIRNGFIQE